MKYTYETPVRCTVNFIPRFDGTCRKTLVIPKCVSIKTGKEIVIRYLAKNDKVHGHKYTPLMILSVVCEGEIVYKADEKIFKVLKLKKEQYVKRLLANKKNSSSRSASEATDGARA